MPSSTQQYLAGETALWLQLSCGEPWIFLGCHNLTGISVPRGDTNPVYCRVAKNTFAIQRTWRGTPGLGALTLVAYDTVLNYIQELACAFNLVVLHSASGADDDPTNYDYLYYYNGVEVTSEDTDSHSIGISPDDQATVMLSMPGTFRKRVKVKQLQSTQKNVLALTVNDINAVSFCDDPSCDNFGNLFTLGCQVGYAVTDGPTAKVLKTTNGGGVWTALSTPFSNVNHNIIDVKCDGDTVIVLNGLSSEYAYSWDAGVSFSVVTTPIQVMRKAFMLGGTKVWMVGDAGYVYYSSNRGATVAVQDAGSATAQSLNDISAGDSLTVYAVGNNNAFIMTEDGGNIWSAKTGPAIAAVNDDLYKVLAIPGTDIVFVADEEGNVYRSMDRGDTWETVLASNSNLLGGITGLVACDCNVILAIGNNSDPYFYASEVSASAYLSIDGGNSWQGITLPTNTGINDLICCDVNRYWAVGEDGMVIQIAGPSLTM
jgi:photosystem II stability/assembly factor-like uncharacterized protein